jgi:3-dehydroquinate dehydratase/shikimate dehydrogenase
VTVTARSTEELRRRRDEAAAAGADLVELRVDSVADPDVAGALADRRGRVIVTCRPTWEGGRFTGSEEERRRLLKDAVSLGAEFVDVEWRAHFDDIMRETGGRRIVLSRHDFTGAAGDLSSCLRAMRATGAEVVKLAVKTERLADCLMLLRVAEEDRRQHGTILIGMGEPGIATRVLAYRFGSLWTYAGFERQVGQLTPDELMKDYRFDTVSEATDVYGVVGSPVSHSVSPAMHNAAFRSFGLNAVYLPFRAADADDFVAFGRAFGIKGASVTIPFKQSLFDRVDDLDDASRRIGAINTIRATGGRWLARNTDAAAFLEPLRDRVRLPGLRVSLLGAGGAARAAAVALVSSGARVSVHARHADRARELASIVSGQVGPMPPEPGSWDLLVNCTPAGMYPRVDETPIAADLLTGTYVYDLVYNPTTTRLLREAARAGCQTIGGLDMLVAQAQEQFEWWTGKRVPSQVMREAAVARLAEFTRNENHVI